MRDQFDGAIFEGVLLAATSQGRGSTFGTAYLPIYDPLNPANIMHLGANHDEDEEDRPSGKKCCGGASPNCKGCGTCGTR